jgi:hypothetical protein
VPRQDLIELRGGTAAQWATANPILALDEPGVTHDAGDTRVKIGDGATAWNDLPWANEAAWAEAIADAIAANGSSGRELSYVETAIVQTGITTVVDITGAVLPDFEVTDRPTWIEAETGFTYPVTAVCSATLSIVTAANALLTPTSIGSMPLLSTTVTGARVRAKARVTTPGTYVGVKLRLARLVGTGTITNGFDASTPTTCRVIEA